MFMCTLQGFSGTQGNPVKYTAKTFAVQWTFIIGKTFMPSSFSGNAVSQVKLLHIMSESHKIRKELNCLFDGALHCESSPI